MQTDPIADMLTRVRNGLGARKARVSMPASKMKASIAQILKEEGYIKDFRQLNDRETGHPTLEVQLKYDRNAQPAVEHISRVSRPSLRRYYRADGIPKIRQGLGVLVLTTSKGLMTDKKARQEGIGGEPICQVW